jgi:hypothetical protein
MKNKFKLTKILLNNRYFLNFHSVNDPEHATNFFFGSKNMFLCWYKRPKRLVMFTGCLGMIRNKNTHHRGPVGQPETAIVTVFLPAQSAKKANFSLVRVIWSTETQLNHTKMISTGGRVLGHDKQQKYSP